MSEAFVYCWTDHKTQKLYVGSHKGNENDGYICSSKYMLKEYNTRPSDFTRQIISNGPLNEMRRFETRILQSVDACLNEKFYNRSNANGMMAFAQGDKNPMKNAETINKMLKTKKATMLRKFGVESNWLTKEHAIEASKRISILNSTKIECPHCGKSGGTINMKRYHFNNCKEGTKK